MTATAAATDPEKANMSPPPQRPHDSYDPEKHERPATLSSSSSSDDHHDDAEDHESDAASSRVGRSLSRAASATSRTSHLSRTVSEVRDGMLNQRDLELGEESDGSQGKEQNQDPNLVTWDGPDDKENPKNWSLNKKWIDVLLGTLFPLVSSTRCSE